MRNFIDIVEKANRTATLDSPQFKRWFRNSKVVDASGAPLRVFHGGAADIKAFDKSFIGKNFGVDDEGFFFTTNTSHSVAWYGGSDYRVYDDMYSAGAYAKNADGATYPCFLRIENPLYLRDWADAYGLDYDHEVTDYGHPQEVLDRNKKSVLVMAREDGHDGIIAHHGDDYVFVVFEPNQIKSVFNTKFDPHSDDIMENDYRGEHVAPDHKWGAALYDLTLNDIYPDDVYGPNGHSYYGSDAPEGFYKAMLFKGHPNRFLTIYRAVPKELVRPKINPGDWVTTNRAYAVEHGRSHLNGPYKILTKTVAARDLYTEGNSLDEWGYDPQPMVGREAEDAIKAKFGMKTRSEIIQAQRERMAARAADQVD